MKAFGSLGDWKYKGTAKGNLYDEDGIDVTPGGSTLEIDNDDEYVAGAQITAGLSLDYKFGKGFRFDIGERYYGKNHGNLSSEGTAIDLPGYFLIDTGLSYKYKLKGSKSVNFRLNVNNLTDNFYISRSRDAKSADAPGATLWHGVNTENRVRTGYGRTWNASVRFKF